MSRATFFINGGVSLDASEQSCTLTELSSVDISHPFGDKNKYQSFPMFLQGNDFV
jgi:hypothetical protein